MAGDTDVVLDAIGTTEPMPLSIERVDALADVQASMEDVPA